MTPKLAIVTTCMGRLEHLKDCATNMMGDPRVGKEIQWIVVDYACPDKSGDWLETEYGDRVQVVRIQPSEEPAVFHKPMALNTGAMVAIDAGIEFLAFMDADTLISPSFFDYLLGSLSLDTFLIVEPDISNKDLTGFLSVSHRHFLRAGGFDASFIGWGAEDLELRLKLFLKVDLNFSEIPFSLVMSVPHEDTARTANYEEKDKDKSHNANLELLCDNVFNWTGKPLAELYETADGPSLRRLLCIEPYNPRHLL